MKKNIRNLLCLWFLLLASSCDTRKSIDKNVYRGFKTFIADYAVLGIRFPEYCINLLEYKNFKIEFCLANLCYDSFFGELKRYYDINGNFLIEMVDELQQTIFTLNVAREELRKIDYAIPASHNETHYNFEDFNKKFIWSVDLLDFYKNEGKTEGTIFFKYKVTQNGCEYYEIPYIYENIDNMVFFRLGSGRIVF